MSVVLEHVGPIEHLEIPTPEGGGVVVLRASNGAGKSLAINAVQRLLGAGGKHKPPVMDGAKRASVEGWGARLNISGRVTATGELECESIEGRFDLATLVDPGVADPEAADVRRIKALLSLAEAEADLAKFKLDEIAIGDWTYSFEHDPTDDLVTLAAKVKRYLEAEARRIERGADTLAGEAKGLRAELKDAPTAIEGEADVDSLQSRLEDALERRAKLREQEEIATRQQASRREAKEKLASLGDADVQEAKRSVDVARGIRDGLAKEIEILLARLREMQNELVGAEADLREKIAGLASEERKAEAIALAREVITDPTTEMPHVEVLKRADDEVIEWRQKLEHGITLKRLKEKLDQAKAREQEARQAKKHAERIRDAAKNTDNVLSDAVAELGVPLFVRAGRLVTEHKGRGVVPYAELSHGERWSLAIALAVRRVGERGVIGIPQEAWEGLDDANRKMLVSAARRHGVLVITGEARDGELTAEVYA